MIEGCAESVAAGVMGGRLRTDDTAVSASLPRSSPSMAMRGQALVWAKA